MSESATALDAQVQRLAAIRQKQQDRENGIRAQAIKQGRELERAETATELAKLEANHAGQIEGMEKAQKQEIARAVKAHERGSFWFGAIMGAAGAAIFVSAGYLLVVDKAMNQAFNRAQEIAAASTLVGAATQRRD